MAGPADDAAAWVTRLLEHELLRAGKPAAVPYLPDILRHAAVASDPTPAGGTRVVLERAQAMGNARVEVNAVTGAPLSWYLEALARDGDRTHPAADLLQLAIRAAAPPEDAVLEVAAYEEEGDRTFFRARWRHERAGLPVEGDFLDVLVNGRHARVFAISRNWRNPQPGQPPVER